MASAFSCAFFYSTVFPSAAATDFRLTDMPVTAAVPAPRARMMTATGRKIPQGKAMTTSCERKANSKAKDRQVSRQHCLRVLISDSGSSYVNGHEVSEGCHR